MPIKPGRIHTLRGRATAAGRGRGGPLMLSLSSLSATAFQKRQPM
jgi:hypothetical protein